MRNFDTPLDEAGTTRLAVQSQQTVTQVVEQVEVVPKPATSRTDLLVMGEDWSWEQMRDYVVHEIEARFGAFPHDSIKEASIFKSFIGRHGKKAAAIAKHAFEVCDGRWAGAPISVTRFCKNSDPFFAEVIVERLVDQPVQGW